MANIDLRGPGSGRKTHSRSKTGLISGHWRGRSREELEAAALTGAKSSWEDARLSDKTHCGAGDLDIWSKRQAAEAAAMARPPVIIIDNGPPPGHPNTQSIAGSNRRLIGNMGNRSLASDLGNSSSASNLRLRANPLPKFQPFRDLADELACIDRAKAGDRQALERLWTHAQSTIKGGIVDWIKKHPGAIDKIGRQRKNAASSAIEELVSFINDSGLFQKVLEKFDTSKGYRFSTYLVSPLRWALQNYNRKKEIKTTSIETPIAKDSDATIGDTLTDQQFDTWSADDERAASKCLNAALDQLDDRARRIVIALHGLNGAEAKTKKAVADDLGISPERVRQIAIAAAKKTGTPELVSNQNFS